MELEIEEKLQLIYKKFNSRGKLQRHQKIRSSNKIRIQGRNIRKQI